jgi:hypothetical protein
LRFRHDLGSNVITRVSGRYSASPQGGARRASSRVGLLRSLAHTVASTGPPPAESPIGVMDREHRVPATTGTARRLAKIMLSLGFISIKSPRLMPMSYRDTVARGWARPVRESQCQASLTEGETVGPSHLHTPIHPETEGYVS